jgi:hypothetical protein
MLVRSKYADPSYDNAVKQESWPQTVINPISSKTKTGHKLLPGLRVEISFEATLWNYDGSFQSERMQEQVNVFCGFGELIPLKSLRICPLRYLAKQMTTDLLQRGKVFWACRRRRYVTYNGWDYDRTEHFVSIFIYCLSRSQADRIYIEKHAFYGGHRNA